MDPRICPETYGNPIWPEGLLQDFNIGAIDLCDETQSVSSTTSTSTDEMIPSPFIHTRWGSSCSSPCEDDTDSLSSSLCFSEDISLGTEDTFLESDLSAGFMNMDIIGPQQNEPFEVRNPNIALSEQPFINEAVMQNLDFWEVMRTYCAVMASQKPNIDYSNGGECNEVPLEPVEMNQSILNCTPLNNGSSISELTKLIEDAQRPQLKQGLLILPDQKPSLSELGIKQEVKDTHDEVSASRSKRQPKACSPPPAKPQKRKYVRRATARKTIQLYEFMLRLLDEKDDSVMWVSREEGVFKLLKSKIVAKLWGKYKKNENMSYESLSRALRHYYAQDILDPVPKKLHYKFCKRTLDNWYK